MQVLAQVKQRGKEKMEGRREGENKAGRGRVLDWRSFHGKFSTSVGASFPQVDCSWSPISPRNKPAEYPSCTLSCALSHRLRRAHGKHSLGTNAKMNFRVHQLGLHSITLPETRKMGVCLYGCHHIEIVYFCIVLFQII